MLKELLILAMGSIICNNQKPEEKKEQVETKSNMSNDIKALKLWLKNNQ